MIELVICVLAAGQPDEVCGIKVPMEAVRTYTVEQCRGRREEIRGMKMIDHSTCPKGVYDDFHYDTFIEAGCEPNDVTVVVIEDCEGGENDVR